ncbi:FAD-dependent pyridine nucleotide-disulphide oxidoreductase [Proteiniborus sp. DW1]|uniref:NAD(P)/FAD-dependent oxidoreductase n=1 Tax=Proteiniborus sp. DW1 TaxID=1889883 RepID=UPI00092E086F|nr:FAD-dependent oxidoreductase [Proteiniborus sp. DW1]SCG81659.1 FAD-dependent pyridine nucleotide-disulphide oxidoreductase [Proteiniborus sp. DW1]
MTESIVIVGNGIAAISAIKSIREIDKASKIHLIGEERFYPYNRVRLSKGLLSGLEENKILLQKKEWYKENDVILYLDKKVISVDTNKKVIGLSDGNIIDYTKLLLANGSHNVTPLISGIKKHGVYTLKTLQDAWDIIDRLKDAQVVLIIGGGIQGLETAWIMAQAGKKVILSHRSPRFMRAQLDEKAAKILEKAVLASNIQILFSTQVSEIKGNGNVEGFMTTNGNSYECDTIIYSVGTKPNIDILDNTPIKTNNGIIVNKKMETNIDGIYAAGDVAEYNNQTYGLWNIAIGQGKVAGYNIIGKDSIYEHIIPVTTLNAFNLSLFSMGIVDESKATNIIIDDRSQEGIYNKVLISNDKIIGAIVVGNIKVSPALKSAIEKETSLKGMDYKNTSFDELIQVLKSNR